MRIAALVLGIVGGIAASLLGAIWLNDYYEKKAVLEQAAAMGLGGMVTYILIAGWFLASGLITGVVGGILALKNRGKIGGMLMLITVVGGAIQPLSLIFTFPLLLGAIFAFVAKPKRVQPAETQAPLRPAAAHQ